MEYYSAIKEGEGTIPFVATWVHLEIVMLYEKSQSEKDK